MSDDTDDPAAAPATGPSGRGPRDGPEWAESRVGEVVMEARRLTRGYGRKIVLSDLDLTLRAGEAVVILGRRNAGKSVLARVLAGVTPPDAGHLRSAAPVAPLVGSPMGFGSTASVERDLGLRAAAYGISTRDHMADVAALLDDPDVLRLPFNRLDGVSRVLLTYGASYLTPSDIYIADAVPVPQVPAAQARIGALFRAARQRAAVLWLVSAAGGLRALAPDRCFALEDGRLHQLAGIDEAEARFMARNKRVADKAEPEEFAADDDED